MKIILVSLDPDQKIVRKYLEKLRINATYLILEASRENRADRVQKSFDFLQSAVALDVTFSGLNNKLADGAVLARLGRLDGLDELGRAAQTELRANNAGSLLLEQELNQSLAFLGNEVVALI
jgi:triphosphoribosyl-dephospho-CoA synthetase